MIFYIKLIFVVFMQQASKVQNHFKLITLWAENNILSDSCKSEILKI